MPWKLHGGSDGPAKRFKWKAIEDNNAFDRRGEEGTAALSLDQSTDLRYKATILVPNFVKKVGTFFGSRTQLKRMK